MRSMSFQKRKGQKYHQWRFLGLHWKDQIEGFLLDGRKCMNKLRKKKFATLGIIELKKANRAQNLGF